MNDHDSDEYASDQPIPGYRVT